MTALCRIIERPPHAGLVSVAQTTAEYSPGLPLQPSPGTRDISIAAGSYAPVRLDGAIDLRTGPRLTWLGGDETRKNGPASAGQGGWFIANPADQLTVGLSRKTSHIASPPPTGFPRVLTFS